jgi:two-component system, NarL family, response regulator NreC
MGTLDPHGNPVQPFPQITVIIADDHAIVREGIAQLLTDYFTVVGLAANGLEAMSMAERLRPTVLIVDLMMPMLNGLEVITQIRQRVPTTKALVLSMNEDETQIARAVKGGAAGYVLKHTGSAELIQAVQAVALGKRYFTASINMERIELFLNDIQPATDPYETLTPRERQILSLVVEGHTSQQIARLLYLSTRTVEVHRANLMGKLGVDTTNALIRLVIKRNGL